MRQRLNRLAIRALTIGCSALLHVLYFFRPRASKRPREQSSILLTGTFYTDAWIITHLKPLAASDSCRRLVMVASRPVPPMPKVEGAYPPSWLRRMFGDSGARLVLFFWLGVRTKPDIVGGFHLLVNGLVALILAGIIRRRSIYFCGGGAREVEGGGYNTENKLYRRLGYPDPVVERHLAAAAARFDIIVTMGNSGRDYFVKRGASGRVCVVPGGFDAARYAPSASPPTYDVCLVGRLSPVKRVDRLLDAMIELRARGYPVTGVIVGDGPSRAELERHTATLGLGPYVRFLGFRDDVEHWLRSSKIFVLTSDSEGLSQAMIQAMLCGLPVVVSDVGDLGDLVEHGRNGYLVTDPTSTAFTAHLEALLKDPSKLKSFGAAARAAAIRLSIENVSAQWHEYLGPARQRVDP